MASTVNQQEQKHVQTVDAQNVHERSKHHLYQEKMLEHHKNPVGFLQSITVTHSADGANAACGDEIVVQAQISQRQIKALAFHGDSCAICRASASMLCENLAGMSVDEGEKLSEQIVIALKDNIHFIGELAVQFAPLASVQKFPIRKQCALLPWQTLQVIFSKVNENN